MSTFEKIDKALNLYYRALGHYDYYDDNDDQGNDNQGKFLEFCEENGLDEEEIEEELDTPDNCMYVEFDENFPFTEKDSKLDEEEQKLVIFNILKSCYQTGKPPDKYRPRKKNLTHKRNIDWMIDLFLDNIARECQAIDDDKNEITNKGVIVPKDIKILVTRFHLISYNMLAPYDFNVELSPYMIEESERIFANLYMYHSKLPNKEDYEPLAIGYANKNFPWLLYVLESFDRDRITRGTVDKKYLKLEEWMVECDFINEYLRQELGKQSLYDAIIKACKFYIRKWKNEMRVLPSKIEMERMYIKDDLYAITEIILNIYKFVKELISTYKYGLKFQCEFTIAVRSTIQEVLTKAMIPQIDGVTQSNNDDDNDKYKHHDIIGQFELNMKENKLPYSHRKIKDKSKMINDLHDAFQEFKSKIDKGQYEERPSTFNEYKTNQEKKKYYTPFPKQRRFCCFIDRREYYHQVSFHKVLSTRMMGGMMGGMMGMFRMGSGGGGRGRGRGRGRGPRGREMMDQNGIMAMGPMYEWRKDEKRIDRNQDIDEITFYTPDDQYLPIDDENPKNGIYPESHFDILHTSMIPELKIFDDKKEDKHQVHDGIKGITSLHGSLLNVQFQIERFDEIRLYIHWHNQCLRLYPQDFWLVLPRFFVKDYMNNAKFPTDKKMQEKIKKEFTFPDKYFDYFYKYISVYGQQKKEWIDKPTEIKYVN